MNQTVSPSASTYRQVLPWIEIALLLVALPLPWILDDFWILFATKICILALLALSFDLVWGYAGIMSFGQALFFGVAGYTTALLATKNGMSSVLILMPVAALIGLVVAFVVAVIVIFGKRIPSIIFVALGTLTGSYVVERLVRGWSYVGGQNGISSLPRLSVGSFEIEEGVAFFYMALALLIVFYLLLRWLVRSQFGLVLAGIRQNESRILFFGYNVQTFKGVTFSLAGLIAGLSGGLFAFHEGFIGPGQLGPVLSTQAVLYVLFGGVGTLVGAILGVSVIELISYVLPQVDALGPGVQQFLETGWPIVLGLLLLVTVMFRPTGLVGFMVSERERIGSFGRPPKSQAATGSRPVTQPREAQS
ncbi:MAG: branched-chain amino acid ABC transporter permease [Burkholderiales bacterium]|nr:branched-chain amino acid ABC transporter permease [Burkholderiales bacterium]